MFARLLVGLVVIVGNGTRLRVVLYRNRFAVSFAWHVLSFQVLSEISVWQVLKEIMVEAMQCL